MKKINILDIEIVFKNGPVGRTTRTIFDSGMFSLWMSGGSLKLREEN